MCVSFAFLGKWSWHGVNIPGCFPEIKLQHKGGGERLKLDRFGPVGYSFSTLWWDRDHLWEVYNGFSWFFYTFGEQILWRSTFFSPRIDQWSGSTLSNNWQDAELANMRSHCQQPQMLSSHLAPNVAGIQRPLGSNPTDMNNFITVLSAAYCFYTLYPFIQQPAPALPVSPLCFSEEKLHFPHWSMSDYSHLCNTPQQLQMHPVYPCKQTLFLRWLDNWSMQVNLGVCQLAQWTESTLKRVVNMMPLNQKCHS